MTKLSIGACALAAVLLAQTAQAQTAPVTAPAPPAPATQVTAPQATDNTVITVIGKRKYKRGGEVGGPSGTLNYNSTGGDAANPLPPGESMVSPDVRFMLGRMYIAAHDHSLDDAYNAYAAKDFPKALRLFKASFDKMGYDAAGLMVARMYLYGEGTDRNTAEAIIWLKRTAQRPRVPPPSDVPVANFDAFPPGSEAAMTLARIYAFGVGVPADPREARRWYARADDLGYYPATHIMGDIWRSGYGGEKSMAKAMTFYKRAAQAGYGPSQYALADIYYSGDDGIPVDATQGLAWLEASARSGYPDGLYAVGRLYETGEGGLAADPQKALLYYKEAAVRGQPGAEEAIGRAFYLGNGLPKDLATARRWFEKAAEGADPDAMFNLAVMMINGEGGDKDLVRAWVWLKIAVAGGHPRAAAALAELEPKMTPDELAKARALFAPAS